MLDPMSIVALVSTANSAYKTLKQGKDNATELLGGMAKFFQAKQQIDKQAAEDEEAGRVDTKAFGARIQLMRMEKELEDYITYYCEGWVKKEWEKFKAQSRKAEEGTNVAQMKQAQKSVEQDTLIRDVTSAFAIVLAIGAIAMWLLSK